MAHQTTLIESFHCDGGPSLTFEKDVLLPLPPAPWYSIGLEQESEFGVDELRVTRVMYLTATASWLAELECSRFGSEWNIWAFIRDEMRPRGWRLRLTLPVESLNEGVEINVANNTNDAIIECRGKLWMVSPEEVRALEEFGEQFVTRRAAEHSGQF